MKQNISKLVLYGLLAVVAIVVVVGTVMYIRKERTHLIGVMPVPIRESLNNLREHLDNGRAFPEIDDDSLAQLMEKGDVYLIAHPSDGSVDDKGQPARFDETYVGGHKSQPASPFETVNPTTYKHWSDRGGDPVNESSGIMKRNSEDGLTLKSYAAPTSGYKRPHENVDRSRHMPVEMYRNRDTYVPPPIVENYVGGHRDNYKHGRGSNVYDTQFGNLGPQNHPIKGDTTCCNASLSRYDSPNGDREYHTSGGHAHSGHAHSGTDPSHSHSHSHGHSGGHSHSHAHSHGHDNGGHAHSHDHESKADKKLSAKGESVNSKSIGQPNALVSGKPGKITGHSNVSSSKTGTYAGGAPRNAAEEAVMPGQFKPANSADWPSTFFTYPYNLSETFWPPGLYSRLKQWSPGYYTNGLTYSIRPSLAYHQFPSTMWVKNSGATPAYYLINQSPTTGTTANYGSNDMTT